MNLRKALAKLIYPEVFYTQIPDNSVCINKSNVDSAYRAWSKIRQNPQEASIHINFQGSVVDVLFIRLGKPDAGASKD